MPRSRRLLAPSHRSLFRSGLPFRLALAAALVGPLWLTIAWAMHA